jgi:hypothetical protein
VTYAGHKAVTLAPDRKSAFHTPKVGVSLSRSFDYSDHASLSRAEGEEEAGEGQPPSRRSSLEGLSRSRRSSLDGRNRSRRNSLEGPICIDMDETGQDASLLTLPSRSRPRKLSAGELDVAIDVSVEAQQLMSAAESAQERIRHQEEQGRARQHKKLQGKLGPRKAQHLQLPALVQQGPPRAQGGTAAGVELEAQQLITAAEIAQRQVASHEERGRERQQKKLEARLEEKRNYKKGGPAPGAQAHPTRASPPPADWLATWPSPLT